MEKMVTFTRATHHSFGHQPVRDFLFYIKLGLSFLVGINREKQSPNDSHISIYQRDGRARSYDGASEAVGGYFAQDPSNNATRSSVAYYKIHSSVARRWCTRVITESTHNGPKVTGVEVIIFPPMVTSLSE
jgi:hypothetical protein